MATASFVTTNFLGGEISQAAQGRLDHPAYKISLSVCLNWIPIEPGQLARRPGTAYVAHTRSGARGRGISFSFVQSFPSYVMQFTDGFLRFTAGTDLVTLNSQTITAISAANPAQVTTQSAHGWPTGSTVIFSNLSTNNPLLQNRQFLWTSTGTFTGTIADALTGAAIDGSTLGAFVSGTIARVLEFTTPYASGAWSALRSVQAEDRTLLLNGVTHPQVLQVTQAPTATSFASFSLGAADFVDGPYLDPISGSVCSPSALNGVIALTFFYQTYDATRAYNVGDFVTYSGSNYQSLTALNQNNTPSTSPSNWKTVTGGAAINGGSGFVTSDIGRLVRLYSQPPLWNALSTYSANAVVSYSDGNGGVASWTAITSVVAGVQPGTSTAWAPNATGAQWTWGQVTAISGVGLIANQTTFGTLNNNTAAFDGNVGKSFAASASFSDNVTTYVEWVPILWQPNSVVQYQGYFYENVSGVYNNWGPGDDTIGMIIFYQGNYWQRQQFYSDLPPPGQVAIGRPNEWVIVTPSDVNNTNPPPGNSIWRNIGATTSPTFIKSVGQHYATGQTIAYATIYPTTDIGFTNSGDSASHLLTINLRGKTSTPQSDDDGVVLGSATINNTHSPITINSNDQSTHYTNVWFEIIVTFNQPLPDDGSHGYVCKIGVAQAQFYSPNINNGSVISLQIRGNPLLYSNTISTWRLGAYSDTTGWPTCGTYAEGRIFLGGVGGNRFDACVSNGFTSGSVELNFAPTGPDGTVSADNAISYTVAGEDVNPILWMKTDAQGVLFGTKSGEYLIFPPTAGAMAPTNVKATKQTSNGCANIEPRRTEHTLVVVHKALRKIIEMFADVFSGKFTAPNLAERAKHLTVGNIAEIAYQQELAPIIWVRLATGGMVGLTYKRDTLMTSQGPTIVGWHRHALGSGRTVESLSSGPSASGNTDTISLVTNDASTGIRHIEAMTDLLDEDFALTACWFLDDAIVPTSFMVSTPGSSGPGAPYGTLTLNGLWPHNGKTVTAFVAGLDCGDFTVSNGSIVVPFGDGAYTVTDRTVVPGGGTAQGLLTAALVNSFGAALPMVVGFTYNSDGQLVRPVESKDTGARSGPGWGKLGRLHRVIFQLYGAVGGSFQFGTDFAKLDPLKLAGPDGTPLTPQQTFTGMARQEVESRNDFDNQLCFRVSRPLPAFITAAGAMMNKEDV